MRIGKYTGFKTSVIGVFLTLTLLTLPVGISTASAFWNPFSSLANVYESEKGQQLISGIWCFTKTLFGFGKTCVDDKEISTETMVTEHEMIHHINESEEPSTQRLLVAEERATSTDEHDPSVRPHSKPQVLGLSASTPTPPPGDTINYFVTNEYITNPTTVVKETIKEKSNNRSRSGPVSHDLLYKQADAIFDSVHDLNSDISEAVNTGVLTVSGNATIDGLVSSASSVSAPYYTATDATATSTFAGSLTVGTTTDNAELTLDGVAYLADVSAPGVTANRLYSVGGSLYWAGGLVGGGSVGSWTTDGTDVWRATGNVGIGTTSPMARLSVAGTGVEVNIGGYFGAGYGVISLNGTIGANTYNFLSGNSVTDNSLYINRPTGGNINFRENNGNSQMVISSGGSVGIGTTTTTHKLTVAGDIGPASDDTYNLGAAGADWGCLYYNGGTQGICASDKRLKENIKELSFHSDSATALDKLTDLTVKTFDFKSAPGSTYTGLIAQEVLEAVPELVIMGDNGYYQVKYGDIQWLTMEAVQELGERTKYFEGLTEVINKASSTALLTGSDVKTFWNRVVELTESFIDGVLTLGRADITYVKSETVETKVVNIEERLCIGDTCVTEDQLRDLLGAKENESEDHDVTQNDEEVEGAQSTEVTESDLEESGSPTSDVEEVKSDSIDTKEEDQENDLTEKENEVEALNDENDPVLDTSQGGR